MSYENEVRPARTDRYTERIYSDSGSYVLPVIALLIVLGVGAWFAVSYNRDSAPSSTTVIERTVPAPSVPAPTPTVPSTPSPAPTTPK